MDLSNILNNDYDSILNTSNSKSIRTAFEEKSTLNGTEKKNNLIQNIPCYFSRDQMDLYKKVIQLHYSDILQLINSDNFESEISDYIKNAMDLLAINLESVSIHPYVLIMSKLPNSNRQLVFKEFVKSQLLAKSGKLYTLKMLIENFRQNKTEKNIVVYFRGDFNINELYDIEKTNYKHLSYIPGDITQEQQLRRNTVTDVKICLNPSEIKQEEEEDDDEEEEDDDDEEEVDLDEDEEDEAKNSEEANNSTSEGEQQTKSKSDSEDCKTKEENIQNSIGGRSSSLSLSSTTQPTRICDILEAVLASSLSQSNSRKLIVKRYDGKKPLKRGSATHDDDSNNNSNKNDDLQVHLISNMEEECPVTNVDLVITLDSTYPFFEALQNVKVLRLFSPSSIDQFLMIKEQSGLKLEQAIMNVVCNRDNAGCLSDDWISEYLEGLKTVSSSVCKSELIDRNFIVGDKLLTEKILEEPDDLFGDFLQRYVDAMDSGDSIFNFLRFVKAVDSKINFAELSDTDIINARKLIKNNVTIKSDDSSITRNTFKINKNLVINFDQRILYQLNRGIKTLSKEQDYNTMECSLLYNKLQNALANLEISEHLNKTIDTDIKFYEDEFNKVLQKILIEGVKFTEDAKKEIEVCLKNQKLLREKISKAKMSNVNNNSTNSVNAVKKKISNKENEADYLKQEISKANKAISTSDEEILLLQQKIQEMDEKITERAQSNKELKRKAKEQISSNKDEIIDALMKESTELYTIIKELPLKRSKRQRRR
ncbi:hypothetical protein ACO0SA_004651 [Hanseniaspora valbyensis]